TSSCPVDRSSCKPMTFCDVMRLGSVALSGHRHPTWIPVVLKNPELSEDALAPSSQPSKITEVTMRKATRILGLLVLVTIVTVSVAQAGPHIYVQFGPSAPIVVAPVPAPYGYASVPYGYASVPYGYAYAPAPYGYMWPRYYGWTGG